MKQITCQNERKTDFGQTKCDRFLLGLPQWVLSGLKSTDADAENSLVLRCPSCIADARFVRIWNKNGKLTFSVIPDEKIEMGEAVVFENNEICVEV